MVDASRAAANLLKSDQSVEVCMIPFYPGRKGEKDHVGSNNHLVPVELIKHGGTHLIEVVTENKDIESCFEWSTQAPVTAIYLKLNDNVKTTKSRLRALEHLAPTDGVSKSSRNNTFLAMNNQTVNEAEYSQEVLDEHFDTTGPLLDLSDNLPTMSDNNVDLRSLLTSTSYYRLLHYHDFRGDLSDELYDLATRRLTQLQRIQLDGIIRTVPKGILLIVGCPGFGKTTALVVICNIQLLAGKTMRGVASSNSAVTNFHERVLAGGQVNGKRLQRAYTASHEIEWLEHIVRKAFVTGFWLQNSKNPTSLQGHWPTQYTRWQAFVQQTTKRICR
jgi:hypothetical protein